ncbi:kinesin-like protein KIF18B [Pollicipes pollicipes]|uniref:kinesin-like protein KIF18B n=1 Tax=Pollicipes pollicipes TaxID=41117 RepID=UPI00188561F3|nr:kinesin-like protein KIF18B [Pollicipes pollicipes]
MTISKTTKRSALTDRSQRRRSGFKAATQPEPPRPGRRPSAPGHSAAAAAGGTQASNVRVVVRVRPENERERQGNFKNVVRPLDDHMLIFDPRQQEDDFYFQGVRQRGRDLLKRASKDVQYMFDRVFHPHHSNQQLFEATTKDVVDTVIEGFNCSVFAYGSTGAGKTHTMLGAAGEPGIIFLTVMELYSRIEAMSDKHCEVSVSYVEVYNETVTDLLTPSGSLEVREDGQRAVVIAGLSQHRPDGPDHLMTILEAGNRNRTQHPTDMNAESSRSHAVFQVVLRQSDSTAGLSTDVRLSKLSLIDLAGSERGSATGHKGARFREGANINRSLLALGSCINALADGKKFVPYRDSKLTRLLKDSIGGNCKTVMIANVTPSSASYEDTHNTLKYADRAKAIKTRLQRNVVSVDMHVSQYARIVEELRQEVASLKARLAERPAEAPSLPPPPPPATWTSYRVLSYMKFVTPELEAQHKEIVSLVEGQKEPPPVGSPGPEESDRELAEESVRAAVAPALAAASPVMATAESSPALSRAAAPPAGPDRATPSAAPPPPPSTGGGSARRPAARPVSATHSGGKLSLSAQKSKSTGRLVPAATQDENRQRREQSDRPAWGRATAPSLPGAAPDKTAARHGLVSSVGKFGLGRNRAGAMAKSRSASVLKPSNA